MASVTLVDRAVSEESRARSEAAKAEANQAFKERHYAKAVEGYTTAIELNPTNEVLYSNRAFAHIRLENFGSAAADATEAISVNPKYGKAYYRRGDASMALGHFKDAVRDFRAAARLAPNDRDLRKKLAEAEKELKRVRFEEALAVPEEAARCYSDEVCLEDMGIDASYAGPRMQGDGEGGYVLTAEFVAEMMEAYRNQKSIHRRFAFQIILEAQHLLRALPSLVDVPVPAASHITVCGDVHGQYFDLLRIFELNGLPSEANPYLFNGDFVDRGSFSVEVILTLLAWKVLAPGAMHLTRGNHEAKSMNTIYGFYGEVKAKYSAAMVEVFRETFCWLPLGFVLCGAGAGSERGDSADGSSGSGGGGGAKVMVVHGGLFARDGVKLEELRAIKRYCEPPESGPMCELLWSDPQDEEGRLPNKRGVGVAFGPDVTKAFLQDNGLSLLVRSHEMKEEGYEVAHDGFCITIFSAPNYCDQMGNKGAFIRFNGSDMVPHFTKFEAAPHPAIQPMMYAGNSMGGMFGY